MYVCIYIYIYIYIHILVYIYIYMYAYIQYVYVLSKYNNISILRHRETFRLPQSLPESPRENIPQSMFLFARQVLRYLALTCWTRIMHIMKDISTHTSDGALMHTFGVGHAYIKCWVHATSCWFRQANPWRSITDYQRSLTS